MEQLIVENTKAKQELERMQKLIETNEADKKKMKAELKNANELLEVWLITITHTVLIILYDSPLAIMDIYSQ